MDKGGTGARGLGPPHPLPPHPMRARRQILWFTVTCRGRCHHKEHPFQLRLTALGARISRLEGCSRPEWVAPSRPRSMLAGTAAKLTHQMYQKAELSCASSLYRNMASGRESYGSRKRIIWLAEERAIHRSIGIWLAGESHVQIKLYRNTLPLDRSIGH